MIEVTVAWWWIITLFEFLLLMFVAYKFIIVHKLKSKFWGLITIVVFILGIVSPIKINGTNSNQTIKNENQIIEMTKVLPKKVQDDSFEKGNSKVTHITKDEIWK